VKLAKHPTLRDVAREAGVSVSLVSHVLNNYPSIREETRQKVWAAREKLGYKPNLHARQLRAVGSAGAVRTRNLALVIVETEPSYPIYMPLITAFSGELLQRDLNPLVFTLPTELSTQRELPACLRDRTVDGFLLTGELSRSTLELFDSVELPYVVVGNEVADSHRTLVQPDVSTATAEAMKRLFDLGHTAIGLIGEQFNSCYHQLILSAYRQALKERELEQKPEWIQSGGRHKEGGFEPMERMLALPDRPTAILFTNIRIAANAFALAREHGLSIPDDLSLLAFSGTAEPEGHVAINRLIVDYQLLGVIAVKMLLERIAEPAQPRLTVSVPCVYREGGTCAARRETRSAENLVQCKTTKKMVKA